MLPSIGHEKCVMAILLPQPLRMRATAAAAAAPAASSARRRVNWTFARSRLWSGRRVLKYPSPSRKSVRKRMPFPG